MCVRSHNEEYGYSDEDVELGPRIPGIKPWREVTPPTSKARVSPMRRQWRGVAVSPPENNVLKRHASDNNSTKRQRVCQDLTPPLVYT